MHLDALRKHGSRKALSEQPEQSDPERLETGRQADVVDAEYESKPRILTARRSDALETVGRP